MDRWSGLCRQRGRRCYTLRAWLTDDPQEAVWAARQLFDAAELAFFQANPGGSFLAEEEARASLESPVVQAISAIQRDLEAIEKATPWFDMRQRAETEGKDWVKELIRS